MREFLSSSRGAFGIKRQRPVQANDRQQNDERDHMQRSGDDQHRRVAEPTIEQVAGELAEHDAAHRTAETDEACDGSYRASREKICWQNHDQC